MHSTAEENLEFGKPSAIDINSGPVPPDIVNLKRKCYFDHPSVDLYQTKIFKPSTYDHQHHHTQHQSHDICVSNEFTDDNISGGGGNGTIDHENVEEKINLIYENVTCENSDHTTDQYVNILFDGNLMPVSNAVVSEANYVNYSNATELDPSWNNVELLDLDQRNYYYSTTQQDTVVEGTVVEINHQQQISGNSVPSSQEDSDDRNLSWLLNYKLDELPHLSPEVNRARTETGLKVDEIIQEATAEIDECDIAVAENVTVENIPKLPKKPPFTYTELIEYALEDKGELTVSGIYQWISPLECMPTIFTTMLSFRAFTCSINHHLSALNVYMHRDRFPFYKSNDDRWKNSVRHNLSINPHFRKGSKPAQGAGHLWTISTRDSESNILAWEHKKQRLELFFKMENLNSPNQQQQQQRPSDSPASTSLYDEAAIAASNLELLNRQNSSSPETLNNKYHHSESSRSDDLKRSAEEILNGVRRTVEVQVINQTQCHYERNVILENTDYLNPVSKEEIVRESGLRSARNEIGSDFYVTEIDPLELGVNMNVNGDEEILFGDDFNLNYFSIAPGNNIMA